MYPHGPGTDVSTLYLGPRVEAGYSASSHTNFIGGFPVTQVSYNDAHEYCIWANRRLPTEEEWEYAARGMARRNQSYPWGDGKTFEPHRLNIWEGKLPGKRPNSAPHAGGEPKGLADGFLGLAPIKALGAQTDEGLYHMLGNVWEWVAHVATTNASPSASASSTTRVLRGGSFVDSKDGETNHLVLVSTRQENSQDSAADNVGFRCAMTLSADEEESEL